MVYKSFLETVTSRLQILMGTQAEVSLRQIPKNNGVILDGLCISRPESSVAPAIYLNGYYEQFQAGVSIDSIISDILAVYQENSHPDETRFRKLLEDNDANTWPGCEEDFKSRDASRDLLAETFHIRSRDPFQRVKELQTGFDPSVLNFSDAYYDTLGLEKPKRGMQRKEKPLFEFPPITFDLYQEDDP